MALSLLDEKPKKEEEEKVETKTEEASVTPKKETKKAKSKKSQKKSTKKTSKKKVKTKKKDSKKKEKNALGPQDRVFYGKKLTRFYKDGKWYYDIVDVLAVGSVGDHKSFMDELKEEGLYEEVFADGTEKIEVEDEFSAEIVCYECADTDTIIRLVRVSEKPFPGPIVGWLKKSSEEKYVEEKEETNTQSGTMTSPPQTG